MRSILEHHAVTRRELLTATTTACLTLMSANCTGAVSSDESKSEPADEFQLNYMLASCMYGYMYVGEILPEVVKCGATHLDLWPKKHGNQREQLTDLGVEKICRAIAEAQRATGVYDAVRTRPVRSYAGIRNCQTLWLQADCHGR